MQGYKLGATTAFFLFHFSFELFAGDFDRTLFSSSNQQINSTSYQVGTSVTPVNARIQTKCSSNSTKFCLTYRIVVKSQSDFSEVYSTVQAALNTWSQSNPLAGTSTVALAFNFDSSSNTVLPGGMLDNSIARDNLGNPTGDFQISFNPPPEILSLIPAGALSYTYKYVTAGSGASLGAITWGGIFINPAIDFHSYDIGEVLVNEIGRLVGLAPSGISNSVMYPFRTTGTPVSTLSADDFAWASALYPASNFAQYYGSVSGKVLDGSSGVGWPGAHVSVINSNQISDFNSTNSRDDFTTGTFSKSDGSFQMPAVPPGQYLVYVEPVSAFESPLADFDDWINLFAKTSYFSPHFYLGAARENNQPVRDVFAASTSQYAATITVSAGQSNSNLVLVTDAVSSTVPVVAPGAQFEKLSSHTAAVNNLGISVDVQASAAAPTSGGGGGCSLEMNTQASSTGFFLFSLCFALCLWVRARWVQKAK